MNLLITLGKKIYIAFIHNANCSNKFSFDGYPSISKLKFLVQSICKITWHPHWQIFRTLNPLLNSKTVITNLEYFLITLNTFQNFDFNILFIISMAFLVFFPTRGFSYVTCCSVSIYLFKVNRNTIKKCEIYSNCYL